MEKIRLYLHKKYQELLQIRDTPHAIAGGIAIGVAFGFTPLFGFKTLLAILIAWLFRCSKLSAAIAVTFHDIFLPIWPVILRWQYIIGFWIMSKPHRLPPKIHLKHAMRIDALTHWQTLKVILPIFIGSVIMVAPLALILYFVALKIVTKAQARKSAPPAEDVTLG